MIREVSGTDFKETATLTLVDDTGHTVEVIAELQDCTCRDGHVTLRLVDLPTSKAQRQDPGAATDG